MGESVMHIKIDENQMNELRDVSAKIDTLIRLQMEAGESETRDRVELNVSTESMGELRRLSKRIEHFESKRQRFVDGLEHFLKSTRG